MWPNALQIFNMKSYKERRNFEVNLRCAFFDFQQVLLSAVKKLLEFESYLEGPISSSQWIGSYKSENKTLSLVILSLAVCLWLHSHIFVYRTVIQLLLNGTVFLGSPRNGTATNECSLWQAKRRLLVHTVMEKMNHWRSIHEWFQRQNGVGDPFLWQ